MGKVRVKICGITTVDDAIAAIDAGADAIGVNMVSGPRMINASRASEILTAISSAIDSEAAKGTSNSRFVSVMLANASDSVAFAEAVAVARRYAVQTIQLYGDDRGEWTEQLQREGFDVWLPHAVQPNLFPGSLRAMLSEMAQSPAGVVLDAHHYRMAGGTGITLDWRWLRNTMGTSTDWPPIILAGGLTPENVSDAIQIIQPHAVDVSSGVESQPGRKDAERMNQFVQSVRGAES